ncbi:hypothetical protein BG015_004732 [Linnemannia schmuckeri]|uniref:F-box domain-containing protein n=1 Tax=Linnemannia schmuckeri TaxID=64567 RepID=A0A9P5S543_9FUNG|nr:hypothetical protein BG015_004732 [Linnemannia schmuckeri]
MGKHESKKGRNHQQATRIGKNQHSQKRGGRGQHNSTGASIEETTSFPDLPAEVQTLVGQFLSQHQLTVCVRVCRAWKALFNPILWRHAQDSAASSKRRWRPRRDATLLICAARGALKTNGHLIQSLRLECGDMEFSNLLESQLPLTLPQLTSIEFIGVSSTDGLIANVLRRSTAGWKQIIFRANHPQMTPCNEIQGLICGLPKLKEFNLLGACSHNVPPDPSLDASDIVAFEAGLDLLRDLKELRKVGLEDMDVNVGNFAEQAWVAYNWPHATVRYTGNPEAGPHINFDAPNSDSKREDNDDNTNYEHLVFEEYGDDELDYDAYDGAYDGYDWSAGGYSDYDPDYGGF